MISENQGDEVHELALQQLTFSIKKRNSWADMRNLLAIIKYVSYSKYRLLQTSLSPLFSSEICRNSFTSSLKQQVDFPEQKQFSLLCKAFKNREHCSSYCLY